MTIRTRVNKKGEKRIQIDKTFRRIDGVQERYKRDAQVQTKASARAEEARVVTHFGVHGTIAALLNPEPEKSKTRTPASGPTWDDALKQFRDVHCRIGGRRGQGLRASTVRVYESRLRSPAFQALLGVPLANIDKKYVDAWEARYLLEIEPSTRICYHVLLRSVLRAYLGDDVPSLRRLATPPHREVNATPLAVIAAILSESDEGCKEKRIPQRVAMRLAVEVAVATGLRASELRALQWKDVDLRAGELTVNAGLIAGVRAPPKSGKPRTIQLHSRILDLLTQRHTTLKPKPTDPVLCRGDGRVWSDNGLADEIRAAAKRLGLAMGAPLHPLRHRFATEVARVDVVSAQRMLGHSSLAVTLRYAHTDDARQRAAVEAALANQRGNGLQDSTRVPRTGGPEGV